MWDFPLALGIEGYSGKAHAKGARKAQAANGIAVTHRDLTNDCRSNHAFGSPIVLPIGCACTGSVNRMPTHSLPPPPLPSPASSQHGGGGVQWTCCDTHKLEACEVLMLEHP